MNKQTICAEISSKFFDYDRATKTFSTDMSQLPGWTDPMRQIWNDSCDAGFVLVSYFTGAKLIMALVEENRLPGVDTTRWTFKSISEDPRLQLNLTIWNT